MRICYLCDEYPPVVGGGVGRNIQLYARRLVELGHSVRVLGLAPAGARAADVPLEQNDQGVEVFRIPRRARDFGAARGRFDLYLRVRDWVRKGEVQLVESSDWGAWIALWPSLDVPLVAKVHGSATYFAAEMGRSPKPSLKQLERLGLTRADFWYACSRYAAKRTEELFRLRPVDAVIYNAGFTDQHLDRDAKASERSQRIVFAGTFTEKKGVFSLAKAWGRVAEQFPEAELHLFGKDVSSDGSITARILDDVDPAARGRVHLRGHVTHQELRREYQTARAACFPSYSEAFALAPMEAMAQGCATVFTKRSSGPELIRDGVDGILVDPDRAEEIATALTDLLGDDDLCARLGRQGRRRVRGAFSLDAALARTLDFYSECVSQFQSRRSPRKPDSSVPPTSAGWSNGSRSLLHRL